MAKRINNIPLAERAGRKIIVDLTDDTYDRLQRGERVRGSIRLTPTLDAEFSAHAPQKPAEKPTRVLRQPHGRVEIFADRVRVRLRIDRSERVDPAEAIDREGYEASRFVEQNAWRPDFTPFGYEY